MEGRTFTVTIRDSVEDYTQLMKEIFDFDLLKKLINGTDDQPPFKFVASAMYGGEFPIVIESSLNHRYQYTCKFNLSLYLSLPLSPVLVLYTPVSPCVPLSFHPCLPANSHALGVSLMPVG